MLLLRSIRANFAFDRIHNFHSFIIIVAVIIIVRFPFVNHSFYYFYIDKIYLRHSSQLETASAAGRPAKLSFCGDAWAIEIEGIKHGTWNMEYENPITLTSVSDRKL